MVRRLVVNVILVVVLVALIGAVGLVVAVGREPSFYSDPRLWDSRRLQQGAEDFTIAMLSQLGGQKTKGPFELTFTEAQVNGLVAEALRPEGSSLGFDGPWLDSLRTIGRQLKDPRVRFDDGRVLLAGRRNVGPVAVVVNGAIRLEAVDGKVSSEVEWLRMGLVPGPAGGVEAVLESSLDKCFRKAHARFQVDGVEVKDRRMRIWGRRGRRATS